MSPVAGEVRVEREWVAWKRLEEAGLSSLADEGQPSRLFFREDWSQSGEIEM